MRLARGGLHRRRRRRTPGREYAWAATLPADPLATALGCMVPDFGTGSSVDRPMFRPLRGGGEAGMLGAGFYSTDRAMNRARSERRSREP